MKLNELFGLLKKKETPLERGTTEQRQKLANNILTRFVTDYGKPNSISGKIRDKLLKRDMLDPIEVEKNNILRHTLIRNIVGSTTSLDDLKGYAGE